MLVAVVVVNTVLGERCISRCQMRASESMRVAPFSPSFAAAMPRYRRMQL